MSDNKLAILNINNKTMITIIDSQPILIKLKKVRSLTGKFHSFLWWGRGGGVLVYMQLRFKN